MFFDIYSFIKRQPNENILKFLRYGPTQNYAFWGGIICDLKVSFEPKTSIVVLTLRYAKYMVQRPSSVLCLSVRQPFLKATRMISTKLGGNHL